MATAVDSKVAELKSQVFDLKASVNSLDHAKTQFQKDLGAALKQVAALEAVDAENADLKIAVSALNAKISRLEAALVAAQSKLDKADAVLAAGKAVKEGLALLG